MREPTVDDLIEAWISEHVEFKTGPNGERMFRLRTEPEADWRVTGLCPNDGAKLQPTGGNSVSCAVCGFLGDLDPE